MRSWFQIKSPCRRISTGRQSVDELPFSSSLTPDYDSAVQQAQFDLSNVSAVGKLPVALTASWLVGRPLRNKLKKGTRRDWRSRRG